MGKPAKDAGRVAAYEVSRLVRDTDWSFLPDAVQAALADMAEELWWRSGGPSNPVNPGESLPS